MTADAWGWVFLRGDENVLKLNVITDGGITEYTKNMELYPLKRKMVCEL